MIKDLSHTVSSFIKAFSYIFKLRYLKYILFSGLISLLAGTLIFTGINKYSENLSNWISSFYIWDFGKNVVNSIADWLVWALLLIVAVMLFRYVVLLITAPIMSMLSESLELELTGQSKLKSLNWKEHLGSYSRGLKISFRNIFRELLLSFLILIIFSMVGLGFIAAPIIFAIQAFYAGFGNYDFLLERKFNVRDTVTFNRSHKIAVVANGAVFLGILFIPIVGIFLAPPMSVLAATVHGVDSLDL